MLEMLWCWLRWMMAIFHVRISAWIVTVISHDFTAICGIHRQLISLEDQPITHPFIDLFIFPALCFPALKAIITPRLPPPSPHCCTSLPWSFTATLLLPAVLFFHLWRRSQNPAVCPPPTHTHSVSKAGLTEFCESCLGDCWAADSEPVCADAWMSRWVESKHKSDYGKFVLTAGKFYGDEEKDKGKQEGADMCCIITLYYPVRHLLSEARVCFLVELCQYQHGGLPPLCSSTWEQSIKLTRTVSLRQNRSTRWFSLIFPAVTPLFLQVCRRARMPVFMHCQPVLMTSATRASL